MTELYLKIKAIYAQESIEYVFKLRKIFYAMILIFACASFLSAYYNSRKGLKLYNSILWNQIADPAYPDYEIQIQEQAQDINKEYGTYSSIEYLVISILFAVVLILLRQLFSTNNLLN